MKEIIATTGAPGAIGPYSQATKAGSLVFVSGQLPIDPATGVMPEDVSAQTKQSLTNGKAILEAAGGTMADVVKTTVFLADMNDFAAMNAVYATFFPEGACPARSAVQVARLPKDAKVEIEFIANVSRKNTNRRPETPGGGFSASDAQKRTSPWGGSFVLGIMRRIPRQSDAGWLRSARALRSPSGRCALRTCR